MEEGAGYSRMADIQSIMLNLRAGDVMRREFRVVDATLSVQQFIQHYLLDSTGESPPSPTQDSCFFAASQGRYRGYIDVNELPKVERSQWEMTTLTDVAIPLDQVPSIRESSSLVEAINQLEDQQHSELTVLSPADAVAGVIDRSDIVQRILQDLSLDLPPERLDAIAQAQAYPPELPLIQLARTLQDDVQRSSLPSPGHDPKS